MSDDLTESAYAAAIPLWCAKVTLQEHIDMMLCWSLIQYAERGEAKPEHTCLGCELYSRRPLEAP